MPNNPAGSTWNKWDLHVHTPASLVHNYEGTPEEAWARFLDDLEKLPPEFKVIGVNDYIFVDGYERMLQEKEAGRLANIELILPVVELRLDKFAGVVSKEKDGTYSKSDWNRINLHVIFDQLLPDVIRQQFLNGLIQCYDLIPESTHLKGRWQAVITPQSLRELGKMIIGSVPEDERAAFGSPMQEGFNNLCFRLDSVLDALNKHNLADRYMLAVGKTEWENMKWNDQSIAEKKNVINRVHLVFTAAENPDAYVKAKKKLSDSGVNHKLFDCSDAHALSTSTDKDRVGNCFTWVKADTTFQGFIQAVTEFDQRVYVGDVPPKHLLVANNRTKYIKAVSVKKRAGSSLLDNWFDVDLPLNQDLVAVIGNKGSGKSALADILALLGDTKNFESFSFLNDKRFREPKTKLASHFTGTLLWHDDTESNGDLSKDPESSSVERIKYLPQRYLEILCNELSGDGSSTFDGELRKIIYTHVPDEQRIGFSSLDALLNFKLSELEEGRKQLVEKLSKLNTEIVAVESRMAPSFRMGLEQQIEAKKRELAALEGARPALVEDPAASEIGKQEAAEATAELDRLEVALKGIAGEEQVFRLRKADALKANAQLSRILQAIANHKKAHEQFVEELDVMLKDSGIDQSALDIVNLNVNTARVDELLERSKQNSLEADRALADESPDGLLRRRSQTESAISTIKSRLGEKQRLYLAYRDQLVKWEKSKLEIVGDKQKPGTLAWLVEELASLDALPQRRVLQRASRRELISLLHSQIEKMVDEYRTLYQPVQAFVQSTESMDMPLPLDFDVRIVEEGFQETFLSKINRQTRGSFAGIEESESLIHRLVSETDFSQMESALEFVEKLDDMLHFDRRTEMADPVEILVADQLRKGNTTEQLYDYLFGLSYLKPRYSLTYDKQEIGQLSPGERGLLLLVFYLLVDKDDIPLVIDQPEENLDNQTIYRILVQCIKTAKSRRQVIMVTHNPNLAVVCDAEQIIHVSCDKAARRFSYTSGAIECPAIKAKVVEILEGTKPAFVNRKRKYGI